MVTLHKIRIDIFYFLTGFDVLIFFDKIKCLLVEKHFEKYYEISLEKVFSI